MQIQYSLAAHKVSTSAVIKIDMGWVDGGFENRIPDNTHAPCELRCLNLLSNITSNISFWLWCFSWSNNQNQYRRVHRALRVSKQINLSSVISSAMSIFYSEFGLLPPRARVFIFSSLRPVPSFFPTMTKEKYQQK